MFIVQAENLNPAPRDEAAKPTPGAGVHAVAGVPKVRQGATEGGLPTSEGALG